MMADAAWRDILRSEEAASFARALKCAAVSEAQLVAGLLRWCYVHRLVLEADRLSSTTSGSLKGSCGMRLN